MVGDGATDAGSAILINDRLIVFLEACPPADLFIGFGGNQAREAVRKQADWFVYDFKELISELKINWN